MKRIVSLIIIATLFLSFTAFAENKITVYVDGAVVNCDPSPVIINSRTLIPARAVFEKLGSSVSWDENKNIVGINYKNTNIFLTVNSDIANINGETKKLDTPASIINGRTMIPLRFVGEAIGAELTWNAEKYEVDIKSPTVVSSTAPVIIQDISLVKQTGYDAVNMTISGKTEITTMVLQNPPRIVIDFKNASLTAKNGSFDGGTVSKVRYAGHDGYVRIVAEGESVPGYTLVNKNGIIELDFYKTTNNFDYLSGDKQEIIFKKGVSVTWRASTDSAAVFNVKNADLFAETRTINDGIIKKIEVSGETVTVAFSEKVDFTISDSRIVFSAQDEIKNDSVGHGIVMLDAGHGGNDPGALGYNADKSAVLANEKDINLSIMLMVYEILTANGIKAGMTRSTDEYLALSEIAEKANDSKAALFVSVHNNSMPDPEFSGTMVLYSLGSTGGKKLAQNILDEVVKNAGTINKGLRDGTNMAVIRKTYMPAVIVECGCLTNGQELSRLMDKSFQRKIAQGIADGIIKTLNE